ncbi:ATPase, T2SS/T4P/T4SS family [Paenibacillus enshidis]|uniref:ATPase, T2SS/T4P/T4SS family n=1 Tax=Paenibacillus enshidis TaxID=1458439 RepID=A0ABV5AYC7_9BACL
MIFKRKKESLTLSNGSISLSLFDPSGADTTELALKLAKKYIAAGQKVVIVELPCVGLPRLSVHSDQSADLPEEKSIDQLLTDFEWSKVKSIEEYLFQIDGVDCILTHPKPSDNLAVLIKLNNLETLLKAPIDLMNQLAKDYNLILFSLQGQLFHPMTLVTLRHTDGVIVNIPGHTALPISVSAYKRLPGYGMKDQVVLYSEMDTGYKEEKVLNDKELLGFINDLKPKTMENQDNIENKSFSTHLGIVNPAEYISYQALKEHNEREFDKKDSEMIDLLVDQTRSYLKTNYAEDFIVSFYDEKKRFQVWQYISDYIRAQTTFQFSVEIDDVIRAVRTEITLMGPLQEALDDPNTSSIECNGPKDNVSEISGKSQHDPRIVFRDKEHMLTIFNKMLFPMGKTLSANDPAIDSQYGGFRISAVLDRKKGGLTTDFPTLSIRKFPPDVYSSEDCIKYGNISEAINQFFTDIYPLGPSVMIGGSVNSGKTAQLNRIPSYLNPITRILTIEDSEEMMLKKKTAYKDYPNIVSFIVKEHENVRRRYNIAKITAITLRQNPDWVIIGEVRENEAASEVLSAANTGNIVAFTIHANDVRMMAVRLTQMAGDTPYIATKVGESIDLLIYQQNINGVRRVTDICELMGFDRNSQPILNQIFKFNFQTQQHERVGKLKKLRDKMIKKGASAEIINRWCEEGITV